MVSSAVLRTESEAQLAGLDALERADLAAAPTTFGRRAWRATWPKLAAVAIVLIGWQFVVVIGAAPSIANGILTGVDHVPPLLLRYGRSLRTGRLAMLRHIALPAAVPSFVGGLKQGWAFAWRSLMAGELLVIIAKRPSLGSRLSLAREFANYKLMMALLVVILIIGLVLDAAFTWADRI